MRVHFLLVSALLLRLLETNFSLPQHDGQPDSSSYINYLAMGRTFKVMSKSQYFQFLYLSPEGLPFQEKEKSGKLWGLGYAECSKIFYGVDLTNYNRRLTKGELTAMVNINKSS